MINFVQKIKSCQLQIPTRKTYSQQSLRRLVLEKFIKWVYDEIMMLHKVIAIFPEMQRDIEGRSIDKTGTLSCKSHPGLEHEVS